MSDLSELYREIILDHGKRPRNHRAMDDADRHAEGFNPLCGDRMTVYLKTSGDRIDDMSFTGAGCAICMASASMMTKRMGGATMADAAGVFDDFRDMLVGEDDPSDRLGDLAALAGVRRFPMRVKCATLPWHTMKAALAGDAVAVTTES